MNLPTPLPQDVLQALGATLLREEGRGDFRQASALAKKAFQDANTAKDRDQAQLYLALVHLLRGQLRKAAACCWAISASAGTDLRSIRSAVQKLCSFERNFAKLDGTVEAGLEVRARCLPDNDLDAAPGPFPEARTIKDETATFLAFIENILIGIPTARNLARYWNNDNLSDELRKTFRQSLDLLESYENGAPIHSGGALYFSPGLLKADLLRRIGETKAARAQINTLQKAAEKETDRHLLAQCLIRQGDLLLSNGLDPQAWGFSLITTATESSALPEQIEAREFPPVSAVDITAARRLYQKAALIWQEDSSYRALATAKLRLAYLAVQENSWQKAQELVRKAEINFRKTEDYRGVGLARVFTIFLNLETGRFEECRKIAAVIGRWGRWSDDLNYTLSLGMLLNRLARHLFLRRGNFEAAKAAYTAARQLFTELRAPINALQNTVDQARLLEAVGDDHSALILIDRAAEGFLELVQQLPRQWMPEHPHGAMLIQFAFLLAIDGYSTANRLESPLQVAHFAKKLAGFISQWQAQIAPPTAEPTPELVQFLTFKQIADSLQQQTLFYVPYWHYKAARRSGHASSASAYWETSMQAISGLPPEKQHFFEAILWADRKQYPEAIIAYKLHLELLEAKLPPLAGSTSNQGDSINNATVAIQELRYHWEQALLMWIQLQEYYRAEIAWQKRCELEDADWWLRHPTPWKMGSALAELYEGLEQYEKALQYCDQALSALDLRRNQLSRDELKTAISNDRSTQFLYHLGTRLAFRQENGHLAFHYSELGKGRALLDLLSLNTQTLKNKSSENKLLPHWQTVNAQLQAWKNLAAVAGRNDQTERQEELIRKIDQAQQELEKLEDQLIQRYPGFHQLAEGQAQVLEIGDIRRELNDRQLLISYAYDEDDLFIWAVSAKGLQAAEWKKLSDEELDRTALALYQQLRKKENYRTASAHLARLLLQPVADLIYRYSELYIAPYGRLHLIPFHALPFAGKYLGDGRLISMLPSASTLQFFREITIPKQVNLLCIGNPTGDLPAAAMEARSIASIFDAVPILGDDATESRIRAEIPQANIIHLATHGDLSEETPLSSAIYLAGKDELNLFELMGIRMKADLVVLSACESGKSDPTNGDEVIGLTRGLLAAGARSAITSLWSVDDVSTALFMQYLYQHLRRHGNPAGAITHARESLRGLSPEAITETLKKEKESDGSTLRNIRLRTAGQDMTGYEHPFYWAPFFYTGRL
ncbi:MAG: CHAT domain-containing protein [Saprospiraceae bacterium]